MAGGAGDPAPRVVLVHCLAGISRSATLVLAFLMHANHWSLDHAYGCAVSPPFLLRGNRSWVDAGACQLTLPSPRAGRFGGLAGQGAQGAAARHFP